MSVYHKEWPLLVLTPSGARYHWESEFRNWLGVSGAAATKTDDFTKYDESKSDEAGGKKDGENLCDFELLQDHQIHVLSSSKVQVLPRRDTRVVICSYGLAPMLAESNKITPGMFKCAIADESHMLKNAKSKRTMALLPILNVCTRCVLLSGTPALAKPAELWPQLQILRTEKHGFWDDENDFIDKYVKRGNPQTRAELHTMLTGTVMIRRLKDAILKDLPKKAREKAIVRVESDAVRREMQELMILLRQGKGVLAGLAKQTPFSMTPTEEEKKASIDHETSQTLSNNDQQNFLQLLNGQSSSLAKSSAEAALEQDIKVRYQQGQHRIQHALLTSNNVLDSDQVNTFVARMNADLRAELQVYYQGQLQALRSSNGMVAGPPSDQGMEEEPPSRTTVLSRMYSLTGQSKIPAVVDFLKRWLNDPTKGKICVFAHHISVLDAIAEEVGLSNSGEKGTYKFIRIDGSTLPKSRQEQIDTFQNDPSVHVALLGITAAGVAVTLTASSQVIFTELFWTPAM
jgi:SNF2 family DNA or RNA helicase